MQSNLDKLLKKTVSLLEKEGLDYFVIGGLAVGLLGEPRMTQDIDIILFISKDDIEHFLKAATATGFKYSKSSVLDNVRNKGAFKLVWNELWVDIIIASTEFEKSALKRASKTKLLGKSINIPSPEDFILLKIIPGRDKDVLDAKSVIDRHKGKLDKKYLEAWAQSFSDEAEDMRIWNTLRQLLG